MSRQGKFRPRTLKNIKIFWNKEAKEWGDDPRVTIRDHYFRLLQMETVLPLIKGRQKVLDIGCGSGFSSIFYAQVVKELIGIDYAKDMMKCARRFLNDSNYFNQIMKKYSFEKKPKLKRNILFEQGDILNIKFSNSAFDTVITERVLVNLPTRSLQDKALSEVARILQPGGLWTLAEATQQGREYTDKLRKKFDLSILERYWHNLYLDEIRFENILNKMNFSILEIKRFETYQFLTRVIHPLIVWPEEPKFLVGFNNAARIISKEYLDYKHVSEIGLKSFLQEVFRPLVIKYDPDKLSRYDEVVNHILVVNPNFSNCSHHVFYLLRKNKNDEY